MTAGAAQLLANRTSDRKNRIKVFSFTAFLFLKKEKQ